MSTASPRRHGIVNGAVKSESSKIEVSFGNDGDPEVGIFCSAVAYTLGYSIYVICHSQCAIETRVTAMGTSSLREGGPFVSCYEILQFNQRVLVSIIPIIIILILVVSASGLKVKRLKPRT